MSFVRTSRAARVCAATVLPTAIGHAAQASSSAVSVSPGSPSPRMNLLARSIVFRWDYFIMQDSNNRIVLGVTPDALRDHIEYSAWASRRLVNAAARLSAEDLTRDFRTADRSVVGTL